MKLLQLIFEPMSQWYVYPHDMCIPGRDTQNTEAPRKTWQLRGTDFVGLYFKVSTDPKYKRKKIRMKLLIWNCFWQVSSQTTALTGQGYQYYYDHRSDPNVSQKVCLPLRLWVLFWNILLIRNCTSLDRPRIHISLQLPLSDMIYQTISGDTHITEQRSQWRLSLRGVY